MNLDPSVTNACAASCPRSCYKNNPVYLQCNYSLPLPYCCKCLQWSVCSVCGHIKEDLVQQSKTPKHLWLSTETIKELLCISCGLQGPFIFVRRLLNTLLMCFQDSATGFSLKAQTRPNYSHFEVSSMVKTCSHGAATVTYILITHLPESCSRSASDSQRLLCCIAGRVCVLSIYGGEKVSKSKCEVINSRNCKHL